MRDFVSKSPKISKVSSVVFAERVVIVRSFLPGTSYNILQSSIQNLDSCRARHSRWFHRTAYVIERNESQHNDPKWMHHGRNAAKCPILSLL